MARRNRNARKRIEVIERLETPTPEQIAHGGYQRDYVMDSTGLKALAYRNTGHDPVTRWTNAGKIDARQRAAIDTVRRLWDIVGVRQRVTGCYGETFRVTGCVEMHANLVLDATRDLERIKGYFLGLRQWWQVFENVCRFGEPAGSTGIALGYAPKTAQIRALTIVQFIADIIADRERI
ncbi:MAG: hypothetical protein ACK40C_09275 [Novosphingobium meiothermophilum]